MTWEDMDKSLRMAEHTWDTLCHEVAGRSKASCEREWEEIEDQLRDLFQECKNPPGRWRNFLDREFGELWMDYKEFQPPQWEKPFLKAAEEYAPDVEN